MSVKTINGWFVEAIKGPAANDVSVMRQLLAGDGSVFGLDVSKVNFDVYKKYLNYLIVGKDCKLNQALLQLDKKFIGTKYFDASEEDAVPIVIKVVKYNNDLSKLHIYVYVKNVESVFCRFYMQGNSLYWLFQPTKWAHSRKDVIIIDDVKTKEVKQMLPEPPAEINLSAELVEIMDNLKNCEKVGDAGRLTESPKKGRKTKQVYHYIKGGLVCNVMSVLDQKYADDNDCDVYVGTPKAKLVTLLKSKPVYECVPF